MELHRIKNLQPSKGNHQQNEMTTGRLGKNIFKPNIRWEVNIQNTLRTHITQWQNINLIFKWSKELNRHFFQENIQIANRYTNRCSTLFIKWKPWANQNHNEVSPRGITWHLLECLLSRSQVTTNVGENVEKRKALYIIGGNINWFS